MNVLVLVAHPASDRSRANRALREAITGLEGVDIHDLYEAYPDMMVDVETEQSRLRAAQALVVQHPFYWYSAPALVKEWLDLVLTHGFAYGGHGNALAGKPWLQAITLGGPEASYLRTGRRVDDFLLPFQASAELCQAIWQPPFTLHGAHAIDERELAGAALSYRARVLGLAQAKAARPPAVSS